MDTQGDSSAQEDVQKCLNPVVGPRPNLTPIGLAIWNNNEQIFRSLVKDKRTHINNAGENLNTLVYALAFKEPRLEMAKILLTEGEDEDRLDVTAKDPGSGNTALHMAVQNGYKGVVGLLLEKYGDKIKVNEQNLDGNTALHLAAGAGHKDVVRLLLECKNINPSLTNSDDKTPFNLAKDKGHQECADALLVASDPMFLHEQIIQDIKDSNFAEARIEYWLNQGLKIDATNEDKYVLLMYAINVSNIEAVQFLIGDKQANVNAQDRLGRTALFWTINLFAAEGLIDKDKNKDIFEFLLKNGANPL